mgnify:CR=1 FL=1
MSQSKAQTKADKPSGGFRRTHTHDSECIQCGRGYDVGVGYGFCSNSCKQVWNMRKAQGLKVNKLG